MSKRNFYELLNAHSNASLTELRANYKQLILQCHPDKLQDKYSSNDDSTTPSEATTAANSSAVMVTAIPAAAAAAAVTTRNDDLHAQCNRKFVAINEAWNTLKDPVKRKQYDAELLLTRFQSHDNVFAQLRLADMKRSDVEDDETITYTYACRCGGQYIVDESPGNAIFNRSNADNNVDNADDDGDDYDDYDNEVIVECSECSLVIALHHDDDNETANVKTKSI